MPGPVLAFRWAMRGARRSKLALSALLAMAIAGLPGADVAAAGSTRVAPVVGKNKGNNGTTRTRSSTRTQPKSKPRKSTRSRLADRLAKAKAKDVIPPKNGSTNTSTRTSQRSTVARSTERSSSRSKLTREQRELAAVTRVKEVLKNWTPKGVELDVRLKPQQLQVNPTNPVVGRGPVDIVVSPKLGKGASLMTRLTRALNPRLNRRVLVQVNEKGHGTILAERSNTILSRVVVGVLSRLPIRELVFDAIQSKEARQGLAMVVMSLASWKTNPQIGAAALVMAGQMITAGTSRRRVARKESMSATAKWIMKRGKSGAGYPSLSEAYTFYKSHLADTKPGTRPLQFRQFVEQLSLQDVR